MKAKDCIDGKQYNLPAFGQYAEYRGAECHGLSHTKEWMLFLTFNQWGDRIIRMIPLDIEIIEIK